MQNDVIEGIHAQLNGGLLARLKPTQHQVKYAIYALMRN